jgi:hypothetical protein
MFDKKLNDMQVPSGRSFVQRTSPEVALALDVLPLTDQTPDFVQVATFSCVTIGPILASHHFAHCVADAST